jgi:anoctamin-10/anoctamin-7
VGVYFLWLGHYTTWLFPAAIVGILAWANVAANDNDPNAVVIPYYSGFMALWATCFLEFWKRKENWYAMRWGTEGFEEEEQARPQFKGDLMPSAITGEMELYFSESEFARRSMISVSVISVLILIVLGVVASLFMLRLIMMKQNIEANGTPVGPILTSVIQAVVIGILNYVYQMIAEALNDNENHRTDTEYEDNLIAKVFIFQYVNSYAAFFYVAFVKPYIQDFDPCLKNNCMKELQTTLGTIFITRLATGIILSTSLPVVFQKLRERENFAGLDKEQMAEISEVERSFMKEPYDVFLGTFTDFADMSIQFGFTTMFISAFPLACAMSFINNYIMLRCSATTQSN